MIDVPSTSTIFAVSFLGALFAIVASLLFVYTCEQLTAARVSVLEPTAARDCGDKLVARGRDDQEVV